MSISTRKYPCTYYQSDQNIKNTRVRRESENLVRVPLGGPPRTTSVGPNDVIYDMTMLQLQDTSLDDRPPEGATMRSQAGWLPPPLDLLSY